MIMFTEIYHQTLSYTLMVYAWRAAVIMKKGGAETAGVGGFPTTCLPS
jgi:hypothetical protein